MPKLQVGKETARRAPVLGRSNIRPRVHPGMPFCRLQVQGSMFGSQVSAVRLSQGQSDLVQPNPTTPPPPGKEIGKETACPPKRFPDYSLSSEALLAKQDAFDGGDWRRRVKFLAIFDHPVRTTSTPSQFQTHMECGPAEWSRDGTLAHPPAVACYNVPPIQTRRWCSLSLVRGLGEGTATSEYPKTMSQEAANCSKNGDVRVFWLCFCCKQ